MKTRFFLFILLTGLLGCKGKSYYFDEPSQSIILPNASNLFPRGMLIIEDDEFAKGSFVEFCNDSIFINATKKIPCKINFKFKYGKVYKIVITNGDESVEFKFKVADTTFGKYKLVEQK